MEVQFPEITPQTPKVTPAGGLRKACNDAGLRVYPTTGDSQTGINRPPVIPAVEIPQTRFPSRVAGRCGLAGGAFRPPAVILLAFRPAQIAPNRLEIPGCSAPGTNRPKGRCIAGEGLFPSPGHYRPHRPSQGNTGRFLGRLQGCSPFSGLHPCTLGRLAASRTTGPLVSRRGRPDSFSRSSVSAPKSLPQ